MKITTKTRYLAATAILALGLALGGARLVATASALPLAVRDSFAYASATTTAETTLVTPSSGARFVLKSIDLCAVTTAATITFKDGTSGTTILTIRAPADVHVTLDERFFGANGLRSATADNVLTATNGTSTTTVISCRYAND